MATRHSSDVTIIGGGPAAAAAALTLAGAAAHVVVVAGSHLRRFRCGETLPPEADRILEILGLRARLRHRQHLPSYGNQSAWGSSELRCNDFVFSPYGPGWHLDRVVFDRTLLNAARRAGATVLRNTRCIRGARSDGRWVLSCAQSGVPTEISARYVIDCSGRAATFASAQGARRVRIDRLVAIVALWTTEAKDRDCMTSIEAMEPGWWYSARLPKNHRITMFFTDADHVKKLSWRCHWRSHECWAQLMPATSHVAALLRSARYQQVGQPWLECADSSILTRTCGQQWLAAGDAAMSLDPLSSYGITAALTLGHQAASAIVAEVDGRGELGTYQRQAHALYSRYLEARAACYAAEQRWPQSAFWARRQAAHIKMDGDLSAF